jgi:hypothetical protein
MSPAGDHLGFSIGPESNNTWTFCSDRLSNMAVRGHNSLRLAEISKIFFFDTTWRMELKIVMNDHCKLLTKCCYFLDRLKIQDGHQRLIRTLQGTFLSSMVPIHPVVLEKKFVLHISHWVAMLTYVPHWWPSWNCCFSISQNEFKF